MSSMGSHEDSDGVEGIPRDPLDGATCLLQNQWKKDSLKKDNPAPCPYLINFFILFFYLEKLW